LKKKYQLTLGLLISPRLKPLPNPKPLNSPQIPNMEMLHRQLLEVFACFRIPVPEQVSKVPAFPAVLKTPFNMLFALLQVSFHLSK
jgi:hypothetical protein